MLSGFPSMHIFATLHRTKPIEIDSRVPILSPTVDQPKAHSNPTVEQSDIKYRQRRAAQSHPNRAVQHSPFAPLAVLSTVGVHQIFGSLLIPKDPSTEQRSPMHQ